MVADPKRPRRRDANMIGAADVAELDFMDSFIGIYIYRSDLEQFVAFLPVDGGFEVIRGLSRRRRMVCVRADCSDSYGKAVIRHQGPASLQSQAGRGRVFTGGSIYCGSISQASNQEGTSLYILKELHDPAATSRPVSCPSGWKFRRDR